MNWIPLSELMPPFGKTVFILVSLGGPYNAKKVEMASYHLEPITYTSENTDEKYAGCFTHPMTHWFNECSGKAYQNVTHWMPLEAIRQRHQEERHKDPSLEALESDEDLLKHIDSGSESENDLFALE